MRRRLRHREVGFPTGFDPDRDDDFDGEDGGADEGEKYADGEGGVGEDAACDNGHGDGAENAREGGEKPAFLHTGSDFGGDDGDSTDGEPNAFTRGDEGEMKGDAPNNHAHNKPAVRVIPKYASNSAEECLYRALIRTYGEELAYLTMQEIYGW